MHATSSVAISSVATAATRWMTSIDVQPAHPPSGDGGYLENACYLLCSHFLCSHRGHAVDDFERSPTRSSTIWRWWLHRMHATSSVAISSVATAATRWMASNDVQPAHPPSGDGGYLENACHLFCSHFLCSHRSHAVDGFERSPTRSSTIWRWWLPRKCMPPLL